jgi:uncharacterized protein GlcG (DUF336 family)
MCQAEQALVAQSEISMNDNFKTIKNITNHGAKLVRDNALSSARQLGIAISLVVVDRSGMLMAAETMDNAPPGASDAALMKAKGAARYQAPTHLTAEFIKTLSPQLSQHALSLPDLCAFQGGVPIKIGDDVIGGLGISGGSGAQDVEIAIGATSGLN